MKKISETKLERINKEVKQLGDDTELVSDGYHTFKELYDFRREYNAALVNTDV